MSDIELHAYCHACGSRYLDAQGWPRTCSHCGTIAWGNPIPVVAIVQPIVPSVNDTACPFGLLTVRRGIEPMVGHFALPGGYVNNGETAREAAVRELFEETGIEHDPWDLAVIDIKSGSDKATSIDFFRAPSCAEEYAIRSFRAKPPSHEVTGIGIAWNHRELAFDSHTDISRRWFAAIAKHWQ